MTHPWELLPPRFSDSKPEKAPDTTYPEQSVEGEEYTELTTQTILVLLLQEDGKKRARARTADDLIKRYHFATMTDTKELYVYLNGYYQIKGEDIVASEVRRLWSYQCTTGDIKEIIEAHIKPQTFTDRSIFNTDLDRTCLLNGILNLKTLELEPFNPNHKFTFQLDITFDPQATCPNIEKAFNEIAENQEDIQTIIEVYAYCLYRSYPTAKIIVLLGDGRNGKSTVLNLLKNFLGKDNVRNMTIQQLEHNEYSKKFLYGRHANINPDIGNKKINTHGAVKALTGSDEIDTNVKYCDNMQFLNYAKLIFGTNDLPQADDTSDAWISRWIFIRFPHKFKSNTICPHCHTQHSIIKDYDKELLKESSGLLNKVLTALNHLRDNNWEFTLSDKAKNMETSYEELSDPVAGFIKECVDLVAAAKIGKTELYDAYRVYCQELGEPIQASNHFTNRLKQHLPDITDSKSGSKRFWIGISLKEDTKQINFKSDLLNDNPFGGLSPSAFIKKE
jgi:putative DNA primase/helicase